ncbi:MAG: RHS repeat domain-containing protein [Terriglobales bacterium]
MKSFSALVILVAVAALISAAQGQSCYTPITSWNTKFNLTGSGSGLACSGVTCDINESASASNLSIVPAFVQCNPAAVGWEGFTPSPAGPDTWSVNDTMHDPCNEGGPSYLNYSGPTSNGLAASALAANVANGTYTYQGISGGAGTVIFQPCLGNSPPEVAPTDVDPRSNWPITFTLPSTPQTLTGSAPPGYTAEDSMDLGATVPYTFTFTLVPQYDCQPCREDGTKWVAPISSSISPENSSLGEDLPVVDTPFQLHYESGRVPGAGKDAVATADALMLGGWTLNVQHAYDPATNTLFLGDGSQRSGYEIGTPLSLNSNLLITSEDGSEVYVFNSSGRHLQTLRPMTGAVKYTFGYDSAGNLITVTDVAGNVTTIQRNASEQPTAIVSPYGQTTTLTIDNNGFLSQVTDPLGNSSTFQNSSTGLLQSRTDANGNVFSYTYDGTGKLIQDADSLGGFVSLAQNNVGSGPGWTVNQTTSMGRSSSFTTNMTLPLVQDGTSPVSEQHTNIWPDGLQTMSTKSLNGGGLSSSFSLPDGTSDSTTFGPDPRWGIQVPVTTSETVNEGSLTMNITGSRTASVKIPGNPFTLETQTNTQTVNGRTYSTVFTASKRTFVETTPVGRKLTTVLDKDERLSSTQIGSLTASDFTYNTQGRLSTMTQGTRKTTITYDADGRLAAITDPLALTTSFGYDADDHPTTTTLPDGRTITYTYDNDGNLASVTPPGKSAHDFAYTAVNLTSTYAPPTVPGTGSTTYAYDLDRDLTQITRPDGQTIKFGYDSAGRLASTTTPTETIGYSYDPNTGNLTAASANGGETLAYGYNGPLLTSAALTGTVAGSISLSYNNNFWVTSESINGANTINYTYDNDGLLTKAGSLAVKPDPKDGLIDSTTLGSATDDHKYDKFGELTGYTAKYGTSSLLSETYTRDADGRISAKTETVGGKKNTYGYSFDPSGRLTGVQQNGTTISSYTYDTNSNRLTATTSSGSISGTYDAQDRLLTYGNASYTYTANGELASQTVGTATTNYQYDVLGNLTSVILPSGETITYVIDPRNRRLGKMVRGSLTAGFLYHGNRIAAQLNASNAIVSQFVYATGSTSPDYMISGGVTYRIFSDQLGSPRLVVNTSTGAIAEQITYDEFGNVLSDTNPGFQPFGFAGGLYDQDTKLVRFGARDYSPAIGRWTAKDPIRFAGGDTNIYGYSSNDPVNFEDPLGLEDCACNQKKPGTITNFIGGFVDEYTNLLITPIIGPWSLVENQVFGTTSPTEIARVVTGTTGSVDTGSTPYFIGQITVDVGTSLIGGGSGPRSAAQAVEKAGEAAMDSSDAEMMRFIERQFGKDANSTLNQVGDACKKNWKKPWP